MKRDFDIIIVGGGIAGSVASIAASRLGADVLIIEQEGYLGGMLTAAGVGPMMSFHSREKQIIKGITDEIIVRLMKRDKSLGHILDTTGYVKTVTPFDQEAMKYELESMVIESGGSILYHTMLAKVTTSDKQIKEITVCNKDGLTTYRAKVWIDATGDADLSYLSNVPCVTGRSIDGKCQPMTLNMKMYNVSIKKIKEFIKANPCQFPRIIDNIDIIDKSKRLSLGGFKYIVKKAMEDKEITFKRSMDILFFETNNPNEVIVNTTRITGYNPIDSYELSLAEIEGRKQVKELEEFLIKRVPGFEKAILAYSGPRIGVRSSRQIVGEYTLTKDDLLNHKKFDDVIAFSAYPIDIHPPEGVSTNIDKDNDKDIGVYQIPYRSLINKTITNLITVGRCISSTYEAQGAYRTTPTVGAIGHAGGVGAAIMLMDKVSSKNVSINKLRSVLKDQGAFL